METAEDLGMEPGSRQALNFQLLGEVHAAAAHLIDCANKYAEFQDETDMFSEYTFMGIDLSNGGNADDEPKQVVAAWRAIGAVSSERTNLDAQADGFSDNLPWSLALIRHIAGWLREVDELEQDGDFSEKEACALREQYLTPLRALIHKHGR